MKVSELASIIDNRYGDPARFLANIRQWLFENRISQSSLAMEAGLDTSNLNRWLNGHVAPSLKNMLIIDEALERILDRDAASDV